MANEVTILRAKAKYSLEELAQMAAPALEAAGAERSLAFGAYARGTADGYSDLDLVVVLESDLPVPERGLRLAELLDSLPVAVDLLVYTPAEFQRGMKGRLGVFDAIAREGVTFYERSS